MTLAAGPRGRAAVVCLASGVLAASLVSARQDPPPQPQQPPPVFRGGANLVYVDVYPKRNGRFLDGLRPQDFQVFEDGKPQKVETFELIRFPEAIPGAVVRDPTSQAEGDQLAADPRNRLFVIYLDLFHVSIAGSRRSTLPLSDFLSQVIGPSDVFGVLTPEQLVSRLVFGRRTEWLEAQLRDVWHWGAQELPGQMLLRTPVEEFLQTCLPKDLDPKRRANFGDELIRLHREDLLMTSLENMVVRLGALKDERKNVLFLSEGWVPRGPRLELLKEISQPIPTIGVGPTGRLGTGSPEMGRPNVPACDREIGRLAQIDFQRRFDLMLTAAGAANVSFYPIDVDGLWELGGGKIGTLRSMASATDGLAMLYTNDLSDSFRKIADELQAYYLLGYYSTNLALDGRFRKIDVKIPQPGVSLTARRGYLAPSEEMRRAAEAAAERAAARPATPTPVSEALADLVRLRSDAALYGHGARTSSGLTVTLELTSREVTSGRWSKGGAAELVVTGQGGAAPNTVSAPLPPGARSVVLAVPIDAGAIGPWKVRGRLTTGTHVLEETFEVLASSAGPIGDARWFRGAAAVSAPLRPAAERLFRRAERLRVEWPVSAPLDSRVARLLDRRGEPLAVGATVTEFERDGERLVAVDVALAPLADGDYLIELVAGQGATSVRRLVAFRAVR